MRQILKLKKLVQSLRKKNIYKKLDVKQAIHRFDRVTIALP